MVLRLAQRGAGVFRHLHLSKALSCPARVAAVHTHARRVSPVANGLLLNSIAKGAYPLGARAALVNSYATAARSKGGAKKTTKSTKSTRSTKSTPSKATPKKKTTKKTKPASKPKPRKQLTEKQKEAKAAKAAREKINDLKATALLDRPKRLSDTMWTVAVQHKLAEAQKNNKKGAEAFKAATALAKSINAEERERFTALAESNRATNKAAYSKWVQSHTPLQIKDANHARRRLAKLKNTRISPIDDDRLVKRPRTAYLLFFNERNAQGDFKHMAVKDITVRVAEEWKGLTNSEKEKYQKLQAADRERYNREYKQTYGEAPKTA